MHKSNTSVIVLINWTSIQGIFVNVPGLHSLTVFSICSIVEHDSLPPLETSGSASGPTPAPAVAQQQRVPIHKPFTQSRLPPDLPMHPAPRHITEEELRVLESCLHRWRSEVENDTRGATTCLRNCTQMFVVVVVVVSLSPSLSLITGKMCI